MGHGIQSTDHMFTTRKPSWHGLEDKVFEEYPDRATAQATAHPWENVTERIFRQVPYIDEITSEPAVRYEEITEFTLNTRSDDGTVLGAVRADSGYTTNNDLYEIAEALQDQAPGKVLYETAGSLYGGRKVWVLVRLAQPIEIKGDPHGTTLMYYALQNSYDGSTALRGQAVNVRVQCANTSLTADLDATALGTEISFKHVGDMAEKIEQAKQALAGWRNSIHTFKRMSEFLIAQPVSDAAAKRFAEEFIPMPPPKLITDRAAANVVKARATLWSYLEGPTCEGINRTSYGLLQAALEYREWGRAARSAQTRFKRAVLDKDTYVSDAVALAQLAAKESVGVV